MLRDERDIYELCANQAQRRVRACLEAIIPGDVVDVAMTQTDRTLKSKADTSLEAMAKMVEAFTEFGVTKEQIEKRIQRRLSAISPAQVVTLKRIYASLRDGMSEPSEWFEAIEAKSDGEGDPAAPEGSRTDTVKNRMKAGVRKKPKAAADTDTHVMTYAEVADALNAAAGLDELNDTGDLIRHVVNARQREELEAIYRERAAGFS